MMKKERRAEEKGNEIEEERTGNVDGHKWLCHICETIARLPLFVMSYKPTCEEKQGYWMKIARRFFFFRWGCFCSMFICGVYS